MNKSINNQDSLQKNPDNPEKHRENAAGPSRKKATVIIIILLFVSLVIYSRHEAVVTIDCTPEIIASKPDVIMLGAWWCSYCYRAKEYFQHNNIHYCEYDMENTTIGKQLYRKHGGGLPVLLIGKHQLNGFSKQHIETALALLNK